MVRLLKFLAILVAIGVIGVVGYGYLGDLSPDQQERSLPVELDAGS